MSILDKISLILDGIEEINGKLDRLLASGSEKEGMSGVYTPSASRNGNAGERRHPTDSKPPEVKETRLISPGFENTYTPNEEKEEVDMDLTHVVLLKDTDKAFLAFKNSMQIWVAKSHLEGEYKLGNTYDLKVKEESKWILKKLNWKPFTVVKG